MSALAVVAPAPWLVGVDFSSAPSRRKPIVMALGHREAGAAAALRLVGWQTHETLDGFGAWLRAPGAWLGAFDLPFGLPRELVEALGWPLEWAALIRHYATLSRPEIRATFAAFCAARPAGAKFAHRACDGPAGSSPSMKWVNPPVALMLHAGAPLLLEAGVHLPGLYAGDRQRVALEGYPGLLARRLIGTRSYKSDERAKQTPAREAARRELVAALEAGDANRPTLGGGPGGDGAGSACPRLRLDAGQREALVADASGDRLDAVLCLVQAAWASTQPGHGLPAAIDPLEGWIVGA